MTGFDGGPWPGAHGLASPCPLSATGEERWRVDLPSRDAGVLVAANGMRFVDSERGLHAFDGSRVRWTVDDAALWAGPLLSDSLLVTSGHEGMAVREQRTGSVVSVIEKSFYAVPVPMGDDLLVFRAARPGATRRGGHLLRATRRTGEVSWEIPVPFGMSAPMVVGDNVIVVDNDGVVCAFDGTGTPVWTAIGREFRTDVLRAEPDPDDLGGQLLGLSDGTVLLGTLTGEHIGYVVVDPRRGEVRPLKRHLPPDSLAVVLPDPDTGRDLLVLHGWPDSDSHGESIATVTVVDLADGAVRQHHQLPADPRGMVVGANGVVAVTGGPTWERWTKYHGWPGFDLRDQYYVLFLDRNGVRAEWRPGAPITGPLAVGPDGDVLVPVMGQLVSVG